jgi:hypothetical protein
MRGRMIPFGRTRKAAYILVCALSCMALLGAITAVVAGTEQQAMIAGFPPEEALRLGERMYRDGILPSGEPLKAIVKGDIPMEGREFTCANCHQRSGFGSLEGTIRTAPINGTQLYSPLSRFKGIPRGRRSAALPETELFRPAYTDETLARAMRTGQDPAGRQMSDTMPVYFLSDRDMAILVFYLKNLSTGNEPGVTDSILRFATVITEEVPKADREAMLAPLQFYIRNWRISRSMERSTRTSAYIQEGSFGDLRTLSLSAWELKGPAETWQGQLEEYYRREPVFALLGGITTLSWEPIQKFCDDHKVPAIFPITDHPVLSANGGYTFYLSKGLAQEGESAARYLHSREDLHKDLSVVQVFRKDRSGQALARAFQETWTGLGHAVPEHLALERDAALNESFWNKLRDRHGIVLLWLNADDFPDLASLAKTGIMPAMVFASSSLLGSRMYSLPEKERASVYFTYPYSLPRESKVLRTNIEAALRKNGIPITNFEIELKMYSLFSVLSGPLSRMRTSVYRDYFVEMLEATPDMSMTPVVFPRLSFGTGQRYASKGCYIVQLTGGQQPELVKKSNWIIH